MVFSGAALFAGEASASPFGCQCLYPVVNTSCGMGLSRMLASVDPRGPSAPIFQSALTSDPVHIYIYMHCTVYTSISCKLS